MKSAAAPDQITYFSHSAMTRWTDSPLMREVPVKVLSRASSSTNALNSSVKPESLPFQGGVICMLLPAGSFTRGTRTSRARVCRKKFRCR